MTEIIEPVTLDEDEKQALARQLVAQAEAAGIDLVGPDGLLTGLTKQVLETALDEKLTEHLGYPPGQREAKTGTNERNGTRSKTVLTEIGPVELDVPRDRDGSFEPPIVKKRQRRLNGVDELVLSLTARGLTTGEISAHFAEVYGAGVSKDTVSRITDKVVAEMAEWQTRPLDEVYPVIFIDALVVKVRDGQVTNKPFYVVIGVTTRGERDIVGIWAGDGGEGAKFWLNVLTEIKNRGVADVCIAVCDGLKGLPDAITTVWELAQAQTCVIHLIRNTFRYAARQDWDAVARDLKPIYTAINAEQAQVRMDDFAEKWVTKYPAAVNLWRSAWGENIGVPGLRRGDPQDHLHHERDRVAERALPSGGPCPRALPERRRGAEVSLPGDPVPGPDRAGSGTMGHPVEGRAERVRDHLRGANQPLEQLRNAVARPPFIGHSPAGNGDSGGPVIAVANGQAYAMGVISGMTGSSPDTCQGLPGAVGGRECSSELFFAPVGQFLGYNTEYGMLVYAGS